jgi:3-hydroxyacyl-CoA dehydrogenase
MWIVRRVSTLGVIGAGQMGTGIAYTAARAGISTVLVDSNPAGVDRAMNKVMPRYSEFDLEKEIITDAKPIIAKVTASTDLATLSGCDYVVEAIVEDKDVKFALYD